MMLNPKYLGLAGGIIWGAFLFFFTFLNMFTGYGSMWAGLMVDAYPGYTVTALGSLIGLAYGFIDAFVGLYLLAWLYNKLGSRQPRS
jgi:hypothetical protein